MSNKKKNLTQAASRQAEKDKLKFMLEWEADFNKKLEAHMKSSPNHKMPVTRRDFMSLGLMSATGVLLGPSLDMLMARVNPAFAATVECPAAGANLMPALIELHLDGGGHHPLSQTVPRSINNEPLANYARLGLGATPTLVTAGFVNGAEFYDNQQNGANAGFYAGLMASTQATTRANVASLVVPWADNGDGNQAYSIMGLVAAAGAFGSKIGGLGTVASATGLNAGITSALGVNPIRPTRITNLASLTGALNVGGALAALDQNQRIQLARTLASLSDQQAAQLAGQNGGANVMKLIQCATTKNLENATSGAGNVDPTATAGMAAIWGTPANGAFPNTAGGGNKTYNNTLNAIIAMNVLNGNAAGGAINFGGEDAHAQYNNRTEQEQSAFRIGEIVGRIMETARLFNRKVVVKITQNGSVVNDGGTPTDKFNDDDNNGDCTGGAQVFFYDPARAPLTLGPAQIGGIIRSTNLQQNARVDKTFFTSNVARGEAAIFYNFCQFASANAAAADALFDKAAGAVALNTAERQQVKRILAG